VCAYACVCVCVRVSVCKSVCVCAFDTLCAYMVMMLSSRACLALRGIAVLLMTF